MDTFTWTDLTEVGYYSVKTAIRVFFNSQDDEDEFSEESEIDDGELSDSEDRFAPLCHPITESAEEFVEENIDDCVPLESVFHPLSADLMKNELQNIREPSQCRSFRILADLTPGEDRDMMTTCATVCY